MRLGEKAIHSLSALVFAERSMPHLPIPDAELIDIARDQDVARDPRVFTQERREQHPPPRIDCQLVCARDVVVEEGDGPRIEAVLG